jgi:hypothetical protein
MHDLQHLWKGLFSDIRPSTFFFGQISRQWEKFSPQQIEEALRKTAKKVTTNSLQWYGPKEDTVARYTRAILNNMPPQAFITTEQVIAFVSNNPGLTAKRICERLGMSAQSFTKRRTKAGSLMQCSEQKYYATAGLWAETATITNTEEL